jgi:hypothetical protein
MPRTKGRSPITFAVSPELLVMIDAHAQVVGLDRYDVLRIAIAKGMVVLRLEHELLMDRSGTYNAAMLNAIAGQGNVDEHMKLLEGGVTSGFERDFPAGPNSVKMPRAKKVKANA